jgi:hypothetical protein
MLATALDVYFSDPALGGNKIGAFNGLGSKQPVIGSIVIDLTKVCAMNDGNSGSGTCSGTFENASSAFGGATSMTVLEMPMNQNNARRIRAQTPVRTGTTRSRRHRCSQRTRSTPSTTDSRSSQR